MLGFSSALVTGGTGFIGSALVRRLIREGVKVYCIVRAQTPNHSRLEMLSGCEIIEVQAFQTAELRRALAGVVPDIVFNLASYGVNQQDRDPEAMLEGNVDLVTRLLLAIADKPVKRFIHTGSCSEYSADPTVDTISESHEVMPATLYGAAKAASVIYGNALAAHLDIPFVTLRLFGVFGIGEEPTRLVPYLIERLKLDEPVDLTPGEQVRDLLYIDDVVEAFIEAGRVSGIPLYAAYNVCSGQGTRVRDVAEAVADAMNKPHSLLQFGKRPYRPDESLRIVGDCTRFMVVTRWQPKVGLREGIERMVKAANAASIG
jgi:nucleoside-diphosphate-sugar epimerase